MARSDLLRIAMVDWCSASICLQSASTMDGEVATLNHFVTFSVLSTGCGTGNILGTSVSLVNVMLAVVMGSKFPEARKAGALRLPVQRR